MSDSIAIRGGRILDPGRGLDLVGDVLIRDGRIAAVGPGVAAEAGRIIDAVGLIVCPGLVDIHCHLRDPGFEHKETIETGTRAAARGGFTTVCCMPNTEPSIDSRAGVGLTWWAMCSSARAASPPSGRAWRRRLDASSTPPASSSAPA